MAGSKLRTVKRIYLDQNKWIDLAAAEKEQPKGAPFGDVLVLLRAAVDASEVSLPLSSVHYMETNTRRHWESRRDLGVTMLALSRLHTIAPPDAVVPAEIDRALRERYGRPASVRPLRPFGRGASHAFAREIPRYRIPEDLVDMVADRWDFERQANQLQEALFLTGAPPAFEKRMPDFDPLAHLQVGERYARDKEALRELRQAGNWHRGEGADRLAKAQALTDHLEVINDALERAGISADLLLAEGPTGMSEFREAVPTMFASSELERLRHSGSQKAWERQDLLDISALAVACVYCDIVVTERFWVDAGHRAELDERFGTTLLHRLTDLPALVV